MSAKDFIETLSRIGYPKANGLDPEAVEWAFENDSTLPFLKWFCNGISEDNIVSAEDQDEYAHLQDAGEIFSGSQLEEALKMVAETDLTTSSLETDLEQLRDSLARAQAEKNVLMARCNKLSVHHLALRNRAARMEEVGAQEIKACHQMMDQCNALNGKIGEVLHDLAESVERIISLYKKPCPQESGNEPKETGHFPSQLDLTAFHEAEEKFSHDLTVFTKKQFFEGMANIAGDKDTEQYDLLDVSSPEKMVAKGKGKDTFLEDCQEFSRLQQIFPQSECNRINALVNAKRAHSAVQEARSVLHILKSGQFPGSPTEISRLHHAVEQDIESAKTEAAPLHSSLPDIICELGSLQGTEILTGDYDLKLKRQDYFTKNQDKVIEHLVRQRARNEFLTMLYDLEIRCHRETHLLLSAARQMLEKNLHSWQQRMKDLDNPDLSGKRFERSVVDTRDTSSSRLYHQLGESGDDDDKMLYLRKGKLVDTAKSLHERHTAIKASDQTMDEKYLTKVSQLETCVKECESALYAGSSTSSGQPALSPAEIQSTMSTLTSQIAVLEADLTEVIADVNTKKMLLKNNVLQNKERELFTLFHTNPDRLQYVVNGLCDRLKAQNVN